MAFTGAKRKPLTEEAGESGAAFGQEGLKEFGMPDSKLLLAVGGKVGMVVPDGEGAARVAVSCYFISTLAYA